MFFWEKVFLALSSIGENFVSKLHEFIAYNHKNFLFSNPVNSFTGNRGLDEIQKTVACAIQK